MAQELRAHAAVNPLTQGLSDMAQSWGRLAAELVPQVPELPGLIQQSVASLDGQDITEERLEAAAKDIASHVEEAGYSAEASQLLRRMGRAMYELLLVLATQEELRAMGMLLAAAPNPVAEAPRPKQPAPPPQRPPTPMSGPVVASTPSSTPPLVPPSKATGGPTPAAAGKAAPPPQRPGPAPQPAASAAQPAQQAFASAATPDRPKSASPQVAGNPASPPAAPRPAFPAAQVPEAPLPISVPPALAGGAQRTLDPPSSTADPGSAAGNRGASPAPPSPVGGGRPSASTSVVGPTPVPTVPRAPEVGSPPATDSSAAIWPPTAGPAPLAPAAPNVMPAPALPRTGEVGPPPSTDTAVGPLVAAQAAVAPAPPRPASPPNQPASFSPAVSSPGTSKEEGPATQLEVAPAGRTTPGVQEVPGADLWGFDPSEREPEPAALAPPPGPALEVASTPVEAQPSPAVERPTTGPGAWTVRLSPRRAQARDHKVEARRHELKPLVEEIVKQVHEQRRAVSDRGTAKQAVRASAEAVPPADLALAAAQLEDLLQANQHERATALALRVTEAFPGEASAELACRAGEACRAAKQDDLAILNFTTAVLAAPPFEQACWQLAGMALERKDPQLAPVWLEFVARLLRVRGADEDAVVVYRQLVNLCPRRQDVREILSSASLTGSLPD
jgi:hypothetical protein